MFPNSQKKRDEKKGKCFLLFFPLKFALGLDMNKNPYLDIYELGRYLLARVAEWNAA